ncbi:MAG: type I-C CRISPR-associated protein Cas8c/Csd1 [Terriglobia bacterium]
MILQALHRLAEREGLIDDLDFEPKPVAWLVRVSKEGELLGIRGTHYTLPAEGKKKPKQIAKTFWIPRRPTGKSGTKAPSGFLVENAKYVFGLPTKDKSFSTDEGKEKCGWFRELVARCAGETNDEASRAIVRFLDDVAQGRTAVNLPDDCRSNDLFAFQFAPDIDLLVHERPKVREYWKRLRRHSGGDSALERHCLVTGDRVREVGLFELIKKVPGGTTSGVGLVSFNKGAFESYGWSGNDNAPISRDAAESCATAINRLLDPGYPDPHQHGQALPQRNLRLSADTVVCYWSARKSGDEFTSAFGGLLEARPEIVKQLYQSIWRGRLPEIVDESAFYALTLSGTQGRAIVRDWFESTVASVARHLATHFKDLTIVRNTPKPREHDLPPQFAMSVLLKSLAPQGDSDRIPTPLIGELIEAALHGTPYPFSLLQRAVERTRSEIGNNDWTDLDRRDARAALIKAVLNRRRRFFPETTHYKEVQPNMDPTNLSEGYALGRLMAVLERIQQEAIGDVNASVVDRYFSGASATPKTVFVRLLKNARHHVTKAKDDDAKAGFIFRLDKLIDELASRFDPKRNGFPSHLDLDQQGLFVLGYHQMRKWLWMSREERSEWERAHAEAPREYLWSRGNE